MSERRRQDRNKISHIVHLNQEKYVAAIEEETEHYYRRLYDEYNEYDDEYLYYNSSYEEYERRRQFAHADALHYECRFYRLEVDSSVFIRAFLENKSIVRTFENIQAENGKEEEYYE